MAKAKGKMKNAQIGNGTVEGGRARLRRAETRFLGRKPRLDRVSPSLRNCAICIFAPALLYLLSLKLARAIFLDRDGTLIQEKEYLHRPEEVAILPGAAAALRRLREAGFRLFIVSNQSGVGRGRFTLEDVAKVNARLTADLAREGVGLDKIYIAPEAPEQPSRGRKPSPRFLLDARDEFGLRLEESYLVGDKMIDLECGWNAGVKKSILVRTGYGREVEKAGDPRLAAAVVADDLAAAAAWILARKQQF